MSPIDLLGKIIEISHSNLEIASRIDSIVNIIAQDMRLEEVIVYTLDKDKRLTCRFTNQKSILSGILNQYRCHVGEGIVGTVAQKRAPQFFTIKDIPPRFGCLFYPELDGVVGKYKTFAFLPLSDDSYIYGVLIVSSSNTDSIRDSEKILLSILSRELGGILRSYELILSSKKRISEFATLSELGKILASNIEPNELLKNIALIIARALNATFVTIKIEDTFSKLDSQRVIYGVIDPSIENYVYELEKEVVRLKKATSLKKQAPEQHENSLRSSLYASPVLSKGRILGTITMGGEKSQQDFASEGDGQYLINTIANYISSGLENTLLNIRLRDVVKELNDAQKRLIEQEKFRSLGEMTTNIAHEIKNPLVIIGGFTKRLAKKIQLDQKENRYIDIILKEVSRLETILNELLSYVKENPMLAETCDMNDCIDEVLYLFTSDTAWEQVQIVKEYDKSLPSVECDSQQIRQVFINILMNAYEAMHGNGKIIIKTEQAVFNNRPFLAISFIDTGGGIDPAIIDNIFNPFFTTKDRGTGLGLAISNKIVMNHKGHIEVKNSLGEGGTFIVHLPVKNNIIKEEFL